MGFAGRLPGGLSPPPPIAPAGAPPVVPLASQAMFDISSTLGNQSSAVSSVNAKPAAGTAGNPIAKAKGAAGITPTTTAPSLSAPMTGDKTLTGQ